MARNDSANEVSDGLLLSLFEMYLVLRILLHEEVS